MFYVGRRRSGVMHMKWVECNIYYKDGDKEHGDFVLNTFVSPYVRKLRRDKSFESWHYFREPEIRLRFYGEDAKIDKIHEELDSKLTRKEKKSEIFLSHAFGRHGENGEYYGESYLYGIDVWNLVYKSWEALSDVSLKICSTIPYTDRPIKFHAQRFTHLFLNQMGMTLQDERVFFYEMLGSKLL